MRDLILLLLFFSPVVFSANTMPPPPFLNTAGAQKTVPFSMKGIPAPPFGKARPYMSLKCLSDKCNIRCDSQNKENNYTVSKGTVDLFRVVAGVQLIHLNETSQWLRLSTSTFVNSIILNKMHKKS